MSKFSKAKVLILATGGTIAAAQNDVANAGYQAGMLSVGSLIEAIPQLETLAEIEGEQFSNIPSQDISHDLWIRLGKRIEEAFAGKVEGIVVTHGTDTIEETAFFLHLLIHSRKPLVLCGAMRPATAFGADGPANLYNAVALAANPEARGRGQLVLLSDSIHLGREVRKSNTTRPDAFFSPNTGPIGTINTGKAFFFQKHISGNERKRNDFHLADLTEKNLPHVEIVYMYANCDGRLIEAARIAGAKGIVIAGLGDGNFPKRARESILRARKDGIAVVRASRVGSGRVDRNIEQDDSELGTIAALNHSPQNAGILLMLALMKTDNVAEIQKLFEKY